MRPLRPRADTSATKPRNPPRTRKPSPASAQELDSQSHAARGVPGQRRRLGAESQRGHR